jgi:hypothetical protein
MDKQNKYKLLVGKSKGKSPPEKPRHGWIILGWILER